MIGLLGPAWRPRLDEAGFKHAVHRFSGECSPTEIERVKAADGNSAPRTIVGAGGGKVLDTARAAAADLGLPVVNCPTVASSDAPCSALSVIYTDEGVFQEYRFHRKNPDLVLVDTEVIAQAPPRLRRPAWAMRWPPGSRPRRASRGTSENIQGGGSTRGRPPSPIFVIGPCSKTAQARSGRWRPRS